MFEIMLIIHLIGLAMGVGTSFAFMFVGIGAAKLPEAERNEFLTKSFVISKMGHIGLTLLLISGGYMMTDLWEFLGDMGYMQVKLGLVLLLILLIILLSINMKKAVKTGEQKYFDMLPKLGSISLLVGLGIIVMAVLQFN